MAKTSRTAQTKITSTGTCNYCNGEFDKTKMTQHLKHCKARAASIKQADEGGEKKTRLFHILVEGTYLPMYWMHLEMPAKARLYDLDDFLRAIWLECCDHLSEFEIGKERYTSAPPDFGGFMLDEPTATEGVIVEEQLEEEFDDDDDDDDEMSAAEEKELIAGMGEEIVAKLAAFFPQGLANAPLQDIEEKITELALQNGGVTEADVASPEWHQQVASLASLVQSGLLSFALQMFGESMMQDQGMDVRLRKVLKVGTKFSHTYDFGSSTYLSLRVIGEREGVMTGSDEGGEEGEEGADDEMVHIMARNEPPVIPCRECGKPATRVIPGYGSVEYGALCATCEIKGEDAEFCSDEDVLPVVNSPRVGICGYTGDVYDEWYEGDEEDDDEEGDEEA